MSYLKHWIIFFIILIFTFCGPNKDISYKDISSTSEPLGKLIYLEKEKEIILDTGNDIIGGIFAFKISDENFLVIDSLHSKQCYLFDSKGKLLKKIGRQGEGPGEYLHLLAGCISGNRIFLIDMKNINIYAKNGDLIKITKRPFRGLCNSAYTGPNESIFVLSYNRYNTNKNTIYQLDRNGNLIKSFSPVEKIPPVFDTYFPQTGLCLDRTEFFQYFNFKYELSAFDYKDNKIKNIKLTSPFYTSPIFKNANVKGHRLEKQYRATFTQINGFFKYSGGYLSLLTNWKNIKENQNILEFWDNDFKKIGYCELGNDEYILDVHNDSIIFAYLEEETKLVFKKIISKRNEKKH